MSVISQEQMQRIREDREKIMRRIGTMASTSMRLDELTAMENISKGLGLYCLQLMRAQNCIEIGVEYFWNDKEKMEGLLEDILTAKEKIVKLQEKPGFINKVKRLIYGLPPYRQALIDHFVETYEIPVRRVLEKIA